jgi:predicted Fe-S protein YdhL (DUF1289 family)
MNASSGLCDGCFRTIDEIAAWSSMSAAEKRQVIERANARRA